MDDLEKEIRRLYSFPNSSNNTDIVAGFASKPAFPHTEIGGRKMSHSSGFKFDKVVFKTPREQINALITEMNDLLDEVEYHKSDAKKWALHAMKFDKWQPIDTAPKDGRYLMVGNEDGVWVACFTPTFQSGFQPDNPWISLMLNHRHIEKVKRNYSSVPTHWMPLPQAPKVGCGETATSVDALRTSGA